MPGMQPLEVAASDVPAEEASNGHGRTSKIMVGCLAGTALMGVAASYRNTGGTPQSEGVSLVRWWPFSGTDEVAPPPRVITNAYRALNQPCAGIIGTDYLQDSESVCARNVKAVLNQPQMSSVTHPGARIGAVLSTPGDDFAVGCCESGTEFDRFLLSDVHPTSRPEFVRDIDENTALFVIDMQKDFTTGSFGQPCWASGGEGFEQGIVNLIDDFASKGATVIASKDFHPNDHCSFGNAPCQNTKDYEVEELTAGQRYVNAFPSHCSYSSQGTAFAKPQRAPDTPFCQSLGAMAPPFCQDENFIGAAFTSAIEEAINNLPSDQVEVVFKGFDSNFDSFSAMPHVRSSGTAVTRDEIDSTGSFALPRDRAESCAGRWEDDDCYPTMAELANRGGSGVRPILEILQAREIKKIVVVGLVYDFCVSETALFAVEAGQDGLWPAQLPHAVEVLADYTRPSFDGKPGAPYTAGLCDGAPDVQQPAFCAEGGGTTSVYRKFKADFERNNIEVRRLAPGDQCDLEDGYHINNKPCSGFEVEATCERNVRHALESPYMQNPDMHPGARIGAILNTPGHNFESGCCAAGTEFDRFVADQAEQTHHSTMLEQIDSDTALFVIDMQKDFTVGSFGQPCWSEGGQGFVRNMARLIHEVAARGGTVFASKDMHPNDHCSFSGNEGTCLNTKDYEHERFTADQRYVNQFPSHCSYEEDNGHARPQRAPDTPFCNIFGNPYADSYAGPPWCTDGTFVGAAFDPTILAALQGVPADNVEVVYKGFQENFDSFSAMPHIQSGAGRVSEDESASTGSFALPEDRAAACVGRWEEDACYPTIAELENRGSHGGARSVVDIIKDRGVTKILVVGLVFDFCVSETAIFASEAAELGIIAGVDVQVLADYTRPSFDGKPGAPYTEGICDGLPSARDPSFCGEGGGTTSLYQNIAAEFEENNVDLVQLVPDSCASAPQSVVM